MKTKRASLAVSFKSSVFRIINYFFNSHSFKLNCSKKHGRLLLRSALEAQWLKHSFLLLTTKDVNSNHKFVVARNKKFVLKNKRWLVLWSALEAQMKIVHFWNRNHDRQMFLNRLCELYLKEGNLIWVTVVWREAT